MIRVHTLGHFDVIKTEKSLVNEQAAASKKLWTLYKFMLTHHTQRLTPEQIIETLWSGEDYADPRSTLRRQMHRLRQALGETNEKESALDRNTIVYTNGYYKWNESIEMNIDCHLFESEVKSGLSLHKTMPQIALKHYYQAVVYYQGDYLPDLLEEHWVFPVRNHYRRLFLTACLSAIEILEDDKAYDQIIDLCEKAIKIDTYEEIFHIHYMSALNAKGNQKQALSHYEHITSFYYKEMGIRPSEAMRALYKQLLRSVPTAMDHSNVMGLFDMAPPIENAFYCEPEIFKSIYELERRRSERSGQQVGIAVIGLKPSVGETIGRVKQMMNQLKELLMTKLRKGDSLSQWNDFQMVVLLPGVDPSTMQMVLDRVLEGFTPVTIERIDSL